MHYRSHMLTLAVVLIFLQQVALAFSTFFIARAGTSVATGETNMAMDYVVLFFVTALVGFGLNALSEVCAEKSKNVLLARYYSSTHLLHKAKQLSNVRQMRSKFHSWMAGEVAPTIDEFVSFFLMSINSVLNVCLTLLVFSAVFSIEVSIIVLIQLVASALLISVIRKKVSGLGTQLQEKKLESNQYLETFWNSHFMMSPPMGEKLQNLQFQKLQGFFDTRVRYKTWEQSIAATPIFLSVGSLLFYITAFQNWSAVEIGAAVAVLPRTLQLLGNAHTLTVIGTKFFEIRQKRRNLSHFLTDPQDVDFSAFASLDGLSVTDVGRGSLVDPKEFLDRVSKGAITQGRFLVTGENGSGKSTFVKRAYLASKKAILVDPTTSFAPENGENQSTGNLFLASLEAILGEGPDVVILDEWDANLDENNTQIIDEKLQHFSESRLVLEVRHKMASHNVVKGRQREAS